MKCKCGVENSNEALFCVSCGSSLSGTESSPSPGSPSLVTAPPPSASPPVSPMPSITAVPPPRQAPIPPHPAQPSYSYPVYPVRTKQPFTLTDVFIITAFVLAILGIFIYSVVLLPASIIFSIIGWRRQTNQRTNNLAVAGMIVGICASIVRIASLLNEFIPDWIKSGIFGV